MLQTSIKKLFICLASFLLIVTCASCKAEAVYTNKDYLQYLVNESGIGDKIEDLIDWNVIEEKDLNDLEKELQFSFLTKTLTKLTNLDKQNLISKGIIDNKKDDKYIKKQIAEDYASKAIEYINNKTFSNVYDYKYNDDNNCIYDEETNAYKLLEDGEYVDASFEEVFDYLNIQSTFEIDFSKVEVIPLNQEEESSYKNNKYNLLASNNHVFNKDGFRISYTINTSGINVHVSKELDKTTVYANLLVNKVKPSFKWTYDEGDLKNCYFNVSMNTTEKLGCTIGKYGNYYLSFKDLDSSSFLNKLKSTIKAKDDEVEASIQICEIKTPIPDVPTAAITLRVLIKLYASGRIELVLYNAHNAGFEVVNGNIRFFYDHNDDFDSLVKSSGKVALGINVSVDAAKFRLCDIELDGGLRAQVASTLHLYDSDGNFKLQGVDIPYSILEEITKENPDVLVCGDLSLYWMLDLIINSAGTMMNRFGFSKRYHILDENDQVFSNLHHIENGVFVKTCTRKNKVQVTSASVDVNSQDKITLTSYAEVLQVDEAYYIEVTSLPKNYSIDNLKYLSLDETIATIGGTSVIALKPGSVKIKVYTADGKYSAYLNILVSTG